MFGKRIITFILAISIVLPTAYSPLLAPKAEAFIFGFNFVIDVKAIARAAVDGFAMKYAQKLIDDSVKATVDWAQSGFDGNPAYAVDPQRFFLSAADQVAGSFIGDASSSLSFLCSPFQAQIRIALRNDYLYGGPQYSCTLTGVVDNIQNFYSNFNQGGWDAWYTVTQTSGGNPYSAYLNARADLDSRISNTIGLKKQELDWNNGFLSYKKCLKYGGNPDQSTFDSEEDEWANEQAMRTCIEETTVTPGITIKEQLDKVLPVGMQKLVTVQHIEQLITAFTNGLLKRYVFGSDGLFNRANYNESNINLPPGAPGSAEPAPCDTNDPYLEELCVQNNQNQNPGNNPDQNNQSYALSGIVFLDYNQSGVYDGGDGVLEGEQVSLANSDDTVTYAITFTNSSGFYDFLNVSPGIYRIKHIVPQGYLRTNDDSAQVIVGGSSSESGRDFGVIEISQ